MKHDFLSKHNNKSMVWFALLRVNRRIERKTGHPYLLLFLINRLKEIESRGQKAKSQSPPLRLRKP